MKKTYITLILVLFINFLFSQKETNYWYFGYGAGLKFNNSYPITVTDGALFASEGTATISDINGNLLFYTDGVTVWNKNHQIMTNGTDLWGDSINLSTTQSSIIIPQPLCDSIFYIFTVDGQAGYYGSYGGISYSIVNINLQGGNGEVIIKNVPLLTPTCEKVTAVHHNNGTDIWVMTQQFGTNSKYAWLINSTGLNPIPIISSIGTFHNWTTNWNSGAGGYMKFSPDGTKLASINPFEGIEVFDFNNTTGIVSNPILLNDGGYGLEFSSDGSKLYSTNWSPDFFQWNLSLGTQTLINNSKTIIHHTPVSSTMEITLGLQLGIDCRIYVARYNDTIGVIQSPNEIGLLCNYNHNGIPLNGKYADSGLPNFIQSYFKDCKEIGINSNFFESSFSVYPNPFFSEIIITIEKQNFNQATLVVRNILNQIVFTIQNKYFSNNYQNRINLSFLPNGIYFVDLTIDGNRLVKKIIKE